MEAVTTTSSNAVSCATAETAEAIKLRPNPAATVLFIMDVCMYFSRVFILLLSGASAELFTFEANVVRLPIPGIGG